MLHSPPASREVTQIGLRAISSLATSDRADRAPAPNCGLLQGGRMMPTPTHEIFVSRSLPGDEQIGYANVRDQLRQSRDAIGPASMREKLARTIETEIIPRLMLAHLPADAMPPETKTPEPRLITITGRDVEVFSDLIVHQPLQAARAYIDALRSQGMTIASVITDIFSTTARHLGEMWEQDRCTFVDVSIGMSALQQLLRSYAPTFEAEPAPQGQGHRILLAVVPGEQHTFGLSIVEEYFRRADWYVQTAFLPSKAILLEHVRTERFDVVGLSASGEVAASGIASIIDSLRASSINKNLRILLGGKIFADEPELALAMGADFGVRDVEEAIKMIDYGFTSTEISC
jgi:MerR family transcriptional regulator, light-induced transcriptional regulator